MNFRRTFSILGLTLFSAAPFAFGQLITESVMVHGLNYDEQALFSYSINLSTDTLTLVVDNRYNGPGSTHGTITSFGFNTPFTTAQLGTNGSLVDVTQTWNIHNSTHTNWTHEFDPYTLNAGGTHYTEDYGIGDGTTPNGGNQTYGIEFGEKVTFTFHFNSDINTLNFNGFFDSHRDLAVRWQNVDNSCFQNYSDIGFADLPPAPEPSTYGLMGAAALIGVIAIRRRSQKKAEKKAAIATA